MENVVPEMHEPKEINVTNTDTRDVKNLDIVKPVNPVQILKSKLKQKKITENSPQKVTDKEDKHNKKLYHISLRSKIPAEIMNLKPGS